MVRSIFEYKAMFPVGGVQPTLGVAVVWAPPPIDHVVSLVQQTQECVVWLLELS